MIRELPVVQYEEKTIEEWIEDIQKNGYERIWVTQKKRKDGSRVMLASNLLACFVLHGEISAMNAIRSIWPNIPLSGFTPAMLRYLDSGKVGEEKETRGWDGLTRNSIYAYIVKLKAGGGNTRKVEGVPDTFVVNMLVEGKDSMKLWIETGSWPEGYENFLEKYSVSAE